MTKRQGRRSATDAQKTKRDILVVAADLFCELGYARVSLRTISEKAGVSHSLLRHHFGSKEQIWRSISDGLHLYMENYLRHILKEIPANTTANVQLYLFIVRLLAHMLTVKQPIQLIADAVRQEDALFDYFIDSAGEIEQIVEQLAEQYNREFSATPIKVWEIKWQMIMYAHGAASLTPFLKETWSDETQDVNQCLLKHWQLFNDLMITKLHIDEAQTLCPNSINELLYDIECDWAR
ncbi:MULTISPECIES: TetR/AcrR family transcriptional regulator [Vibrio]|uniref:TetR/AcrR family transcriptional regulator n=1 Tax=Vibrio TaxID=662 RepID=UPI00148328BC|nr:MULTISPECIES: TetR/AcrR family transcriptional regulator [Vibrio]MBY7666757.1 TetR/AcrR family transcriptional regulator [Vibrio anguillarum]MDQ2164875.1 TetR/AcrR family transcriptional regulator [Vibrio anguillarum]NNN96279.1 TetR/AcrR family transcriptional regulator [Vibrio sp. B4-6]